MKNSRWLSRALVLSVLVLMAMLLVLALFNPWHPGNQAAVALVLAALVFYPLKTILNGFIGRSKDEAAGDGTPAAGPEKPDDDNRLDIDM